MDYRSVSLWLDTLDQPLTPRSSLTGSERVDVAIVGAGYTGLWTAYYLLQTDPSLRIVLLERDIAGFGASGRNGGWCSALFPLSPGELARRHGAAPASAQLAALREAVSEVARVDMAEHFDADVAIGGTVVLARSDGQLRHARAEVAEADEFGVPLQFLSKKEADNRVHATSVLGGTYTPHCAAVHPAKLVRGLARRVEELGARICELTRVSSIEPGVVRTDRGIVRADVVIRATEAFTATLPGLRRVLVPVYSLVIATQPLPDSTWQEIGLSQRETFSDYRNLIVYGQRSADGRLVFGGRGAPYHFGSKITPGFDKDRKVFTLLEQTLHELFPVLKKHRITHRWGGPLGIARDWHPSVHYDPTSGLGWAGGYVGDGVATANLAGRTLNELVHGKQTALTTLPWVSHRSAQWEVEPLRWLGANAGLRAMSWADAADARGRDSSVLARGVTRLMGR